MSDTNGENTDNPYGQPNNPDPYGGAPQSNPYGSVPPPYTPPTPPTPPANPYGAPQVNPTNVPGYGGGPQYGGMPGYPGVPAKTDGVSIGALIASLLGLCTGIGFLVGIVLGIIGITRTKNGERPGRGLAIAGLVIGVIGLVVGIIAVVALAVWGVKSVVTPDNARVGQCIDTSNGRHGHVSFLKVPCSIGHDAQVVAVGDLTQADLAHPAAACSRIETADVRAKLRSRPDLQTYYATPGGDLTVGARVVCYVEGSGQLTGDLLK